MKTYRHDSGHQVTVADDSRAAARMDRMRSWNEVEAKADDKPAERPAAPQTTRPTPPPTA